ncbi:MAG: gliding motility-associated C-terminal domain-containing protein [Cyclobacteriaceae bacterium]|nr:gliding motility-associated C-terminal domain-containing protein [Cyclobacteriaceae bacterium]
MEKLLPKILLLTAFLLCQLAVQAQIGSNFNVNAEGWTTPNDADGTIGYSATGGNPGGHVFGSPFVFVGGSGTFYFNFYFVAPSAFLGNRSAYYNGTLRYDVQQSTTGTPNQYAEVTIANSLGVVLYYFPPVSNQPPAAPSWATYSVALNNSNGNWKTTNNISGTAATEIQIQNVLSDLASLQIRGLYRDANTTNRLDNVTLTPPIIVTTQPSGVTLCEGLIATLTTTATNNPSISYRWQRETSPSVWTDISNTGGYSGATTNTLSINTTGNFGGGNYRCRVSGTGANDVFTSSATVTINLLPTAPSTTGNSFCGPGAVTLNASGGSTGQYRWYTVPSGGTAIPGQTNSSYTTPIISTTTNYYVSINNGTCESTRTLAVATINSIPAAPSTTSNVACGPSAVTVSASGGSSGQYRWYTVPTGGTAIPGQTNSSYTTPVISATTNYYVSINNGTCESTRTLVVATINTVPSAPTATGNSVCGPAAITLNASGGSAGQYRWYTIPTGGTALGGQTNDSYTTPVISITTNYYVSINNGTCESNRTLVVATINPIPASPSTVDNSECGPSAVTLTASGGSAGQYRWYTVPSGGLPISGETNSSFTSSVISSTTTYYVSIDNGVCESTRTSVTATIHPIPSAPTAIGNSSCDPAAITLTASGGSAGQYRWYTVPSGGLPISGETNSSFTSSVISTTTTYYVSINDGTCESSRTSVVATIGGPGCINQAPTITASSTTTTISGTATFNLLSLISDGDDNLDPSTLTIVTPPISNADAQINNGILTIDYSGLTFAGTDRITVGVCDLLGSCTEQDLTIEVDGDINVYNGISPNGDMQNELWIIQNIESLPDARENTVSLFNRWGDLVFEISNYDNTDNVFEGIGNNGELVPSGIYFYKITFASGRTTLNGYLNVKH